MALTKLNNQSLSAVTSAGLPSGTVLQVQRTQIDATSVISCASGTGTEFSVLSVNITPVSTSSIIKIEAMINGEWADEAATWDSAWFFYRDSTKLSAPAAGNRNVGIRMGSSLSYTSTDNSSTPELAIYNYFDTPSTTSQVTYKVGVQNNRGTAINYYLNRCVSDTDAVDMERGISMICVTEIAG